MAMSARAEARDPGARGLGAPGTRAGWRPSPLIVVLALTAAGAALRFATLDVQSIWGDESIALVHRSFSSMISHVSSSESTPPLYYSLAWVWTELLGTGPIGFRTLSALAGTLTIPVVWGCGREVSDRVAAWAGSLTLVSPATHVKVREIAFARLRTRHTSGAPCVQLRASRRVPALGGGQEQAFAVTRFVASGEPQVPVSGLVRLSGSPSSEVLFVR
jgi:hypothetical protein